MEALTDILGRVLSTGHGSDLPELSPEEWARLKASSFNESVGDLDQVDGYQCAKCKNKGVIMVARMDSGLWTTVVKDCKCMKVRRTIRAMHRSGLRNVVRDLTFEKFQATEEWQKKIKQGAMEYANNPKGWFFIGGQSGAGKSHLCTAICRKLMLEGREVRYMPWRDAVPRLNTLWQTAPEEYLAEMERIKNAEVLYIDDLFKTGRNQATWEAQRPTGADINKAFEITDYRAKNPALVTILSSECTINDLIDIDEAFAGRVRQLAEKYSFSIGRDRRKNYRLKGVTEL